VRETHDRKERKDVHWSEWQNNFAVQRTGQPAESNNDNAITRLRQELGSLRREVDIANKERGR
jgi:isopentenyldiphosphate isomerase